MHPAWGARRISELLRPSYYRQVAKWDLQAIYNVLILDSQGRTTNDERRAPYQLQYLPNLEFLTKHRICLANDGNTGHIAKYGRFRKNPNMVYAVLAFLFFRYETFHIWKYGPYFRRSSIKCDVSSRKVHAV